jgi:hypothetical protein
MKPKIQMGNPKPKSKIEISNTAHSATSTYDLGAL